MSSRRKLQISIALLGVVCAAMWPAAGGAAGAAPSTHGQLLQLGANTNQSSNWFGYNQGTLEQGGTLFNSITGDWTVPTATLHSPAQDESSSDWIGIGGGCVDAGCTVSDNTLIQTGTEQDISAAGQASYSAWWEIIPGPSISISINVAPGDHMHASIAETVADSNVWVITLQDVTKNETFTQTVPYSSTHATAEWIEETPLLLGTSPGLAALPSLTSPAFDLATVNGAPAKLTSSEEIQLIDSNGNVIGTPSAPDAEADGFNDCTWATTCAAPNAASTHACAKVLVKKGHYSRKLVRRGHWLKRDGHVVRRNGKRVWVKASYRRVYHRPVYRTQCSSPRK